MAKRFLVERSNDPAMPATDGAAIVPSDGSDVDVTTRGIYVGGAGNLTVVLVGGQTVTLNNVPAGSILPIAATRVKATGTTASDLVALW
jgi:hypothetical protein